MSLLIPIIITSLTSYYVGYPLICILLGHCNKIDKKHLITNNIWLGDQYSALDKDFLIDNNIGLVINVTKLLSFTDLDIVKYRIPINDDFYELYYQNILKYFDEAYNLIEECISQNKQVLIHCRAGMQRSATLAALYLMKKQNISYDKAMKIITSKRYIAFKPFAHFLSTLKNYDKIKTKS